MRTKINKAAYIFITIVFFSASVFAQKEESDNRYNGNLNNLERQEWLRDQGFGLFIHFNVDAQLGISISHSLVGASDDYVNRYYNELPKTFDPYKFNAFEIAQLARLSGMKYVVFTAKHHSGFCFWDTKTTSFNIINTPYGKDLLKEYVEGLRKAGIAVGFYFSPEDFRFLNEQGITINRRDMKFSPEVTKQYNDLIRKQTTELFSNYGKIDVLFIDGEPKEPCKEVAWNLQPDVVITRGAVNTPEQTLPGVALEQLWESCITMGTQWNYKPTHDDIKTGSRLIEILIETRAKGGNLLLNVGPHPDGSLPYELEVNLREMAAWNFVNQEAIENVRPWVIPCEENIWFTATKDQKTVYAILTGDYKWEFGARKEFVLGSVKSTKNTIISVLGQNDKVVEYKKGRDAKSRFEQKADGLHISVVRAQRIYDNYKWPNPITVKLENVEPALEPPVLETLNSKAVDGIVILNGKLIKKGDAEQVQVGFDYRLYAGFAENLYNTSWETTDLTTLSKEGEFSYQLKELESGKEYQYRFVVVHPAMKVLGDIKRVVVK